MSGETILAQDYVVVGESPDPENVYLGSPGIARLDSDRLVATYEYFKRNELKLKPSEFAGNCFIKTSDDRGLTWDHRANLTVKWPTPFSVGETLYIVGVEQGDFPMIISRSDDGGLSWSEPVKLFPGRYYTAPTPLVFRDNKVYKAWEWSEGPMDGRRIDSQIAVGDLSKDLTETTSWRLSNKVPYPGDVPMMNFAVHNPHSDPPWDHATGWLEGNMVYIRGKTRVILRMWPHGPSNIGGVCTLTEDGDDLRLDFDWYTSMPGGVCKFYILYDEESDLCWMTANQPTDHLQSIAALWDRGFVGVPANERRILNLYYSLDALNWFHAGTVAMSRNPLESFSYPSMLIDGEDLLVLSRTSDGGKNQHDTNLVTLHRVSDFRSLALDLHPV